MTMLLASMQIGPKISTVNRINIRLISICIYRTQSTTIILYYHFKHFTVWFKWSLNWIMTNISISRYWVILPAYKLKHSKLLGNWISLPIVTQVKPHSEIVVVNNTISQQILPNGIVSCHAHISFRLICNYLYLLCDWVLLWKSSCFVVVVVPCTRVHCWYCSFCSSKWQLSAPPHQHLPHTAFPHMQCTADVWQDTIRVHRRNTQLYLFE